MKELRELVKALRAADFHPKYGVRGQECGLDGCRVCPRRLKELAEIERALEQAENLLRRDG